MQANTTGRIVAKAVKHRREQIGLSYAQLSRQLTKLGRDIPTLGLRRIESAQRRVDVDDLITLALALDVSPITLMMPPDAAPSTGIPLYPFTRMTARQFWNWLTANYPLGGEVMNFYSGALPKWEREELEHKIGGVRQPTDFDPASKE